MTFYSILFAVAFLASLQQLFIAIFTRELFDITFPAVVTLLVFIDTLYTSHYLEPDPGKYKFPMKLLDIAGLILLMFALIVLAPANNSIVVLDPAHFKETFLPMLSCFWLALAAYFACSLVWHSYAGLENSPLSYAILGVFILAAILGFLRLRIVDVTIALVILILLLIYLVREKAGIK
jgi:hypothetical protein